MEAEGKGWGGGAGSESWGGGGVGAECNQGVKSEPLAELRKMKVKKVPECCDKMKTSILVLFRERRWSRRRSTPLQS